MAAKNLVIVESPAKAKTLGKYLGRDFQVKASVGHVVDLPKSKLGVDVKKDFAPDFHVIQAKKKVIDDLKKAAKGKEHIYLASDPDREGEAIAWHIADQVAKNHKRVHRVLINEITKKAVQEAIANPLELDRNKFDAQVARRVLDRLVGYQISPILVEEGAARSERRPGAVGGGAAGVRARARNPRLRVGRVLVADGAFGRPIAAVIQSPTGPVAGTEGR